MDWTKSVRAFLAAASTLLSLSGTAVEAAPPPKLVIAISVDQFASSVYRRYAGSYTGGLKRLSSGIAFPVGYQSHAATETCPGHSTILTGDHPSHTGIVANTWFEKKTGSTPYCVSVPGSGDPLARGPQRMKTTTLGDWLKAVSPASRVVAISGKDRAAITMAGHKADLVAWWADGVAGETPSFGFRTSHFAGPAGPQIQGILDERDEAIASRWRTSPPKLWPTDISSLCQSLQKPEHFGDIDISGTVPPADAVASQALPNFMERSEFFDTLHASPLYDSLTLDFAGDIAERWKLGKGPAPDLLAISLSATDYVGHRYGNGGAEMCAQVHALDASLGKFLARIDALGVPYMVVLTADHGSVDAPERLEQEGKTAQRVDTAAFSAKLNRHLRQVLGIDYDPIEGPDVQQLYVNVPGGPAFENRVRGEAVQWLRQQPEVQTVMTRDEVAAAVPPADKSPANLTLAERLNESFDAERSADIFVEFRSNTTLGWPRSPGYVAGHGSPWDYDRRVPILFWWPGAPSVVSALPIETVDIAPTLAAQLRIPHPPVDGHCLGSITICGRAPAPTKQ
jgi:predicted AlkP superfamily pyrophosphatase or phosphodiesterase